jgi:hypothetical protein
MSNYPPMYTLSKSKRVDTNTSAQIREKEQIRTNWERRQYMQANGSDIIKYNTAIHRQHTAGETASETQTNRPHTNNTPYLFENSFSPQLKIPAMGQSDLKTAFLKQEQLEIRMVAPTIRTNF